MNPTLRPDAHLEALATRLADSGVALPLVSVVVTSCNYGRYIAACLESVRRQTYPRLECLIVDDASTDDSVDIVTAYLAAHADVRNFRLLRRQENGGQMEAFRDGLAQARGVFVMMLDADDVLLPDFLAAHVSAHLGTKAVGFTSSNQYQIDGAGAIVAGDHPDHLAKGSYRYVPQQTFQKTWWIWATASSMLFRRATLELVMPDPGVSFPICADYYLAHFSQQVGNSLLLPGIHGCYRRHLQNNFSANPLVGAINSLGDTGRHPPHDAFRQAMMEHILRHWDRFVPIFGPSGLLVMLFRLARCDEMRRILTDHADRFAPCGRGLLWRYVRFHAKRFFYDRSSFERRLMRIDPPQAAFVPPPPVPGTILTGRLRRRLSDLLLGPRTACKDAAHAG